MQDKHLLLLLSWLLLLLLLLLFLIKVHITIIINAINQTEIECISLTSLITKNTDIFEHSTKLYKERIHVQISID